MKKIALAISILTILTACQNTSTQTDAPASTTTTATTPATKSTWDKSYGGTDKSYDTNLLKLREEIAPKFKVLQFKDSVTGKTMEYNLYIPKNLDPKKSYPLVMFIADSSTAGKGVKAPLNARLRWYYLGN